MSYLFLSIFSSIIWVCSYALISKRTTNATPLKYIWALLFYPLILAITVFSGFPVEALGVYFKTINQNELLDVYLYPISALLITPLSIAAFLVTKGVLFKLIKGNNQYYPEVVGMRQYFLFEIPEFQFNSKDYPDIQIYKGLKLDIYHRGLVHLGFFIIMFSIFSGMFIYFKINNYAI